ncbi:hypothetical protein EXIGLDRAFT_701383 [Exidia glandulosa HHB12029]|uniref:F-box domain-containing protein n=1 Tax=Exidia glandulosa HHB12029 TaxID=1314781 RepID=A0A165LTA8_EXIGL|nr:hypothetical protein EXIGLDRAFT_701383 [Exidia glandulosa HHB12029]
MERLPNELWAEIFSFLDLPALTVASHVDRHRRAMAFDQPQFWRDIDISRPSPSIVHWAERRIHAGADRPISLAINVPEQHPLVEPLLRLISLSLHRMRSLRLCISGIYFPSLCDLLCAPAPLLAHLRIDVSADGRVSTDIPLPTSIFHGASPLLREVELDSVTLPTGAVSAFQSVDLVRVAVPEDAWHEFPSQLFDIFPAVRSLYMYGGGLLIKEPLTPSASAAFAQLDFLDVGYYETKNIVFYRQLPTASIREIVASHSDKDTVRAAVAQLDGSIYMVFAKVDPDIRVIYSSVTTGKARAFAEDYSDFEGERYNSAFILGDPGFLERLVALRVSLSLYSIVCHTVPSSNRITTLILYVDDGSSGIRLPTARLHCPEIRTLELRASGAVAAVDADDLIAFSLRLGPHAHDVALELDRVIVQGDQVRLASRFTLTGVQCV